jgi:hypothetical protein
MRAAPPDDDRLGAAELAVDAEIAHLCPDACQAVDLLSGTAQYSQRRRGRPVPAPRATPATASAPAAQTRPLRPRPGADRITDSAADAFCLLLDLFRDGRPSSFPELVPDMRPVVVYAEAERAMLLLVANFSQGKILSSG